MERQEPAQKPGDDVGCHSSRTRRHHRELSADGRAEDVNDGAGGAGERDRRHRKRRKRGPESRSRSRSKSTSRSRPRAARSRSGSRSQRKSHAKSTKDGGRLRPRIQSRERVGEGDMHDDSCERQHSRRGEGNRIHGARQRKRGEEVAASRRGRSPERPRSRGAQDCSRSATSQGRLRKGDEKGVERHQKRHRGRDERRRSGERVGERSERPGSQGPGRQQRSTGDGGVSVGRPEAAFQTSKARTDSVARVPEASASAGGVGIGAASAAPIVPSGGGSGSSTTAVAGDLRSRLRQLLIGGSDVI